MGPEYLFPSMLATDYISMMKDPKKLGNPLVTTQHFLGTPSFARTSGAEITGTYQLRAHHIRFDLDGESDDVKRRGRQVLASATGHAIIKHFYRKTEGKGEWKLAGLQPRVLYDEGDLKTLFEM
jgi:scytalone dehydratase